MKICINYFGQPRKLEVMDATFNTFLNDDENEIHILWTTWKSENIEEFLRIFPNSYINQIDEPDMNEYKNILYNYTLDHTNSRKNIIHYIKGLYVKYKASETIANYEQYNKLKFDIVITTRTETYINCAGKLNKYYQQIINNDSNSVYVASHPTFDIYNNGSYPDVMLISSSDTMKKALTQINVIDKCNVNGTNWFHPETASYKSLIILGINIIQLDFSAFSQLLQIYTLSNTGPYKFNGLHY
jgi:hypothetical protein